ncbi:MAG TPA: SDR family NAD(P)-dependent oxidoreductase [Usitatibacter sp.]|nr:SDR family NAD(P)-dependent oxidoreductase [Usitatibacter sp.]
MAAAVVIGAGPGLGWSLAKRFAQGGLRVVACSRDPARLQARAAADGVDVALESCDAAKPADVERVFAKVAREHGAPALVAFNAGAYERGGILDIRPEDFERCWRVGCFAGFLVGQAAARLMVPAGAGTILFTGATASLRGGAGFANLASPKFALRAVAQSMARELGPKGIHVAHVIIDGQIASEARAGLAAERGPDSLLPPDAIAENYWNLHAQPRGAWTHELDLRPWVERF